MIFFPFYMWTVFTQNWYDSIDFVLWCKGNMIYIKTIDNEMKMSYVLFWINNHFRKNDDAFKLYVDINV